MVDVALAAILIGMWTVAVLIPGTRNVRFLAGLAAASVVMLASHLLPGAAGLPVRIGTVALVVIAFLFADRVGLGSMTWAEETADRLLTRASRKAESGEPNDLRVAIALLDPVIAEPGPLDECWRVAFRLQRRAWLTRLGMSPLPPSGRTPAESFRIIAVRWLTNLRLRRTIGYRSTIGPLEEAVALRAYFEDIRTVLPAGPLGPEPVTRGPWIEEGRRAIAELAALEVRDPGARTVQETLVPLLELELESHLTAPTVEGAMRYARLSTEVNEAWTVVQAPFQAR
ncbi:MAG TPA: hypothetical protein VIH37_08685 [Candidatus Limnocylindrales bacterium]